MALHCFFPFSPFTRIAPLERGYSRAEHLPGLIGLWPREVEDYSCPGTLKIAALLRKALRIERVRGHAGHWTYDLNRHSRLVEALKSERARLKALERAVPRRQLSGVIRAQKRPAGTLHLNVAAGGRKHDQPRFLMAARSCSRP